MTSEELVKALTEVEYRIARHSTKDDALLRYALGRDLQSHMLFAIQHGLEDAATRVLEMANRQQDREAEAEWGRFMAL